MAALAVVVVAVSWFLVPIVETERAAPVALGLAPATPASSAAADTSQDAVRPSSGAQDAGAGPEGPGPEEPGSNRAETSAVASSVYVGADFGADVAPPPYPWTDTAESAAGRLRRALRTVRLEQAPLLDVLRMMDALGPTPIRVTAAAQLAMRDVRVRLRMRDIPGHTMLKLALMAADVELVASTYPDHVLVHTADEVVPGGASPEPPSLQTQLKELGLEVGNLPDPRQGEDARRALDRLVTLRFEGTPLEEVLSFLRDVTGAHFFLTPRAKAAAQEPVSFTGRESVRAVLDRLVHTLDLAWTVANDGVAVTTRDDVERLDAQGRTPEGPALRDRVVSLDLRGGTLRDLAQALERQGFPVLLTEEAWRSAGTTSFVVQGLPLGAVLCAPGALRHLAITWDPRGGDREVLLVAGCLPAVTTDLLEGLVPPFPAIEEEVATRRATLRDALARRATLRLEAAPLVWVRPARWRGDPGVFEPWPLHAAEVAVHQMAEALDELLSSARDAESAPGRTDELRRALAEALFQRDAAREAHLRLLHAQRVAALEWQLADAEEDLKRLELLRAGEPPR